MGYNNNIKINRQILEIIKEIGVSCAQGYYIGKPEKL